LPDGEREIFLARGLDRDLQKTPVICPSGKSGPCAYVTSTSSDRQAMISAWTRTIRCPR
jgi:hypothetical protein